MLGTILKQSVNRLSSMIENDHYLEDQHHLEYRRLLQEKFLWQMESDVQLRAKNSITMVSEWKKPVFVQKEVEIEHQTDEQYRLTTVTSMSKNFWISFQKTVVRLHGCLHRVRCLLWNGEQR